jgi:RNA polymerase sigma-70 factor (ECF subfamily)
MDQDSRSQRLSRISTLWSLVAEAHHGPAEVASAAQHVLMERYSGAVHRYLLGALRDADAADELFQEFCLRFLRGDFRRADPQRGRFRDFVKTALFHLIVDYQKRPRRGQAPPLALVGGSEPATSPPKFTASEQEFLDSWREELMDRAWLGLAEIERKTGQPCYSVLRFRTDQPALSSTEMAQQLSRQLGKPLTVPAVRQALYRAREKFTDLLLDEVARSLQDPSAEEVTQELIDLGLLAYCQTALNRRQGRC